jgi:DNA transformation protein and related proteins
MKTTPFLNYIIYDVFGESEQITWRAMMGAYVLYYEGKVFAIVDGDELYFKGGKELKDWYLERGGKQFTYTKNGEGARLYYFLVPQEIYENKETLDMWLLVALTVAKLPKKKKLTRDLVGD